MRGTRVPTRLLLVLAALAATQAVVIIAASPFGFILAQLWPPLYPLLAWVQVVIVSTACHLRLPAGALTGIGVLAAIVAMPFSVVGVLLIVLVGGQALVMELAWWLTKRRATIPRLLFVNGAGQLAAMLMAFTVFAMEMLVPGVIALVVLSRAIGALLLTFAGIFIAQGLWRAGVARSLGVAGDRTKAGWPVGGFRATRELGDAAPRQQKWP